MSLIIKTASAYFMEFYRAVQPGRIFAAMYTAILKKISVAGLVLGFSAALTLMVWQLTGRSRSGLHFSPDQVNLALRRTAHHLYMASGDTLNKIPAVVQTDETTWQIRLIRHFEYGALPNILQESLERQGILENYNVAILTCADNELVLGYNYLDFESDSNVPCGTRQMEPGCYQLQLNFPDAGAGQNDLRWVLGCAWMAFCFGFFYWFFRRKNQKNKENIGTNDWVQFGNSKLDVEGLLLESGGETHKLTYREAKLLHFLVSNANQLLERQAILDNVWASEGVLVGRSVDVFISRLRKLLKNDSRISIAAVHGVGYRLEIKT